MEYIQRSSAPIRLVDNQEKWTQPWFDHYLIGPYTERPNKPNDSHWTDNDIRDVLIADFKNNCGYCGVSRPTPRRATNKPIAPRGHVDHYRAKAIYPELTYEWTNYIWSCEACNVEKGEFDDPKYPLLNPCDKTDCDQLHFVVDMGTYVIEQGSQSSQQRFEHTDKETMINACEFSIRRRNRIKSLTKSFDTVFRFSVCEQLPIMRAHIQKCIEEIHNSLDDSEFHFLVQKTYLALREQYPSVAVLLDDWQTT